MLKVASLLEFEIVFISTVLSTDEAKDEEKRTKSFLRESLNKIAMQEEVRFKLPKKLNNATLNK